MIDRTFLDGLGLYPEQAVRILEAHKSERRLRAACVAAGISLEMAEMIVAFVSADDVPTEDPELLRILVSEEWGNLATEKWS